MNVITIPKTAVIIPKTLTRGRDLVVITLKEYKKLLRWKKSKKINIRNHTSR